MSTPAVPPFIDGNNPLLAQVPARLETGIAGTPGSKSGVLTVRTASTTVTVILSPDDLRSWAKAVTDLADQVSSGLVRPSGAEIGVLGNGRRT